MPSIDHLHFAKKLRLPSKAANALQSINMAYSFAENGVVTHFSPGFSGSAKALKRDILNAYRLEAPATLALTALPGGHKGIYGLSFRAKLATAWLTASKNTVFYTRDTKEALFLVRLKRALGLSRPLFYEMHEVLSEQFAAEGRQDKATKFARIEREILQNCAGIISISTLLTEDIKRVYAPEAPIFTAPMGYNPHLYSPVPPVDLTSDIKIAYCGSLYEGKGVHNLLRALRHLPERFKLVVMGGNPHNELENLQRMATELPGRVEFTGQLTPVEVADTLHRCQIFAIPQSTTTHFFSPIKLYEAMGMALPIVATPVPTIAAAVTHGEDAYLAEGTAPEALARAMEGLAGNPSLVHAMQAHARKHARQYTWPHRAKLCLEFMESALS